jgi:hypothetical protein
MKKKIYLTYSDYAPEYDLVKESLVGCCDSTTLEWNVLNGSLMKKFFDRCEVPFPEVPDNFESTRRYSSQQKYETIWQHLI